MRKFGVAFARGLAMAAAVSMSAASIAQSKSAAAPASKYPVKFSNGTSVYRDSKPAIEGCTVHGLRAQPQFGKETGPVYVGVSMVFDEKGQKLGYGQVLIQPVETSVTHHDERPVQVRIDLDGTTYDMPYGEVHQSSVTFLDFRFPWEVLNKIVNAKAMKVYFVDPQSKEAKLFATADLSGGREAFAELGRCVNALPELPTKVAKDWSLTREADGCAIMTDRDGFGVGLDDQGEAGMVFTELGNSHEFTKATTMMIGGRPVKFDYGYVEKGDAVVHFFKFPASNLDLLTPEAKLEISDEGEPVLSGANLFPPYGLLYLKKCAAPLQKRKK